MKWIKSDFRNSQDYVDAAREWGLEIPGKVLLKNLWLVTFLAEKYGGPLEELEYCLKLWEEVEVAELRDRRSKDSYRHSFRRKVNAATVS